jgi:hypothetical protein
MAEGKEKAGFKSLVTCRKWRKQGVWARSNIETELGVEHRILAPIREVEFKVSIALSRNGGNKGFIRDEKKPS